MAIAPGTRLGPYELVSLLGAGGMGEVYRARDTRLDRTVAIKVLASALASDPQLRERFEREARAISSLNHPNICALYDVGREPLPDSDAPVEYLVMEYLQGETLSARLARGAARSSSRAESRLRSASITPSSDARDAAGIPPMSVDEATAIAIQIARALDRAHRQGIVHRDLKPGNVMLLKSETGTPQAKLLDFGLARLTKPQAAHTKDSGGGDGSGVAHGLVSLADLAAPTVSTPLTIKGTVLGTLQYMAPEQLLGKESDARTDIFALGAVLYEMLTGQRPFAGKSQASLIGSILDDEPASVTSLQPAVPPLLDEIVRRALAKDPDGRWQSASDVARQLEWVASNVARGVSPAEPSPASTIRGAKAPRYMFGLIGVLIGAAVAAGVNAWRTRSEPAAAPIVTRFSYELPAGEALGRLGRHMLAVSPDGSRLVYTGNLRLNVRAMSELSGTAIRGTEGEDPTEPFFSPDGQWVAYWSRNQLKKVPVGGGTPLVLATVENPEGASWTGDRILLGQMTTGIVEVPANGGLPKPLITLDRSKGERAQSPQLVADGRAVLFTLRTGNVRWDESDVVVQDLATGQRTVVVQRATDGQLLPGDILLYGKAATLFAVRLDPQTFAAQGTPIQVQEGVRPAVIGASGAMQAAWSSSGTFAFVPGRVAAPDRLLMWLDRSGKPDPAMSPPRAYGLLPSDLKLSPDGQRVAVTITAKPGDAQATADGARGDLWIWHPARNTVSRLTFSGGVTTPFWTADGEGLCYVDVAKAAEVACQPADGTGERQSLMTYSGPGSLRSVRYVSRDKRQLILGVANAATGLDIMIATPGSRPEIRPLVQTKLNDAAAAVSPDGRWIAYQSEESGQWEVYVRPFPDVDSGRWQVSTGAATEPRWSHDGRELFYTFTDETFAGGATRRTIMSVPVQAGPAFVAGNPTKVVQFPLLAERGYDVSPNGRFVFNGVSSDTVTADSRIMIVQNWFEELRRRLR